MSLVATLGLCLLGAATLARAADRDAGETTAGPARDAGADPWAAEAKAAADADSQLRATIEQQARAQCVAQLNAADYDARYKGPPFAAASRHMADDPRARPRVLSESGRRPGAHGGLL